MKKTLVLLMLGAMMATGCAAKRNALAPLAYQQEIDEVEKSLNRGSSLQAIDDLSVLIQINPKDTRALFLRGTAYQNLERFDKALEDFNGVLKMNPNHDKTHYNLGMMYAYKLNEPKSALKHFDRFLDINPQHKQAFGVAKIMTSLDGPDRLFLAPGAQTERVLDKARRTENVIERRAILETAMKENPESPVFPFLLGQSYESTKTGDDAAKAKTYYEKTLAIRPTSAPSHKALGTLLVRQGKIQEGQAHLRKASLFDPS